MFDDDGLWVFDGRRLELPALGGLLNEGTLPHAMASGAAQATSGAARAELAAAVPLLKCDKNV